MASTVVPGALDQYIVVRQLGRTGTESFTHFLRPNSELAHVNAGPPPLAQARTISRILEKRFLGGAGGTQSQDFAAKILIFFSKSGVLGPLGDTPHVYKIQKFS